MKAESKELQESAIEKLQSACGTNWEHISKCRADADEAVSQLAELLDLHAPADTAIIVFGSLARNEWTCGSDVDWTLLVDGPVDPAHLEVSQQIQSVLEHNKFKESGPTNLFGATTFSHELVHSIGGDHDSNRNLTQRILLLLESLSVGGESQVRDRVIRHLFKRYIEEDETYKPFEPRKPHVPRFFLNDVVRYWRTMTVDFAAKRRERDGDKWALRNFKLRMSRKLLFCAGLTMSLSCRLMQSTKLQGKFETDDEFMASMTAHLMTFVDKSPLEILAELVLYFQAHGRGQRIFGAYDRFLGILADDDERSHLEKLHVDDAASDELFAKSRKIAREYQEGLTSLFFDTDQDLTKATQKFGVF